VGFVLIMEFWAIIYLFAGFFMAALEFRDVDNSQKFATQVRQAYKGVGERSLNMGRSFARFGALFTIFQCPVEKVYFNHTAARSNKSSQSSFSVLGSR